MKNYSICYKIGPRVEETKNLLVEAPGIEVAVAKAHAVLALRYPHYFLCGIYPGLSFNSDLPEIYGRRPLAATHKASSRRPSIKTWRSAGEGRDSDKSGNSEG